MRSKIRSRVLPLVALFAVFLTTFSATFTVVRSILHDSHASETRTITVTKIWEDEDNKNQVRPSGITINLVAKPIDTLSKIGSITLENNSTITNFIPAIDGLSINDTTPILQTFYGYTYDDQNTKSYFHTTNLSTTYANNDYPIYLLSSQKNPTYPLTADLYISHQSTLSSETKNVYKKERLISSPSENWTIKDQNTWEYQFTDLDPDTSYSIYETPISFYTSDHMGESNQTPISDNKITIKNTYKKSTLKNPKRSPAATANVKKVKIIKEWDDDNNASGNRPSDITLHIDRQVPNYDTTATFLTGRELNTKLKRLANGSSATSSTADTIITGFVKADSLPANFTPSSDNTISAPTSGNPIYAWLDNGVIYYYTVADGIYLNSDSTAAFANLRALTDISGLSHVDTSRTTTFHSMFQNSISLTNVDALANWDTSNGQNMWGMFQNAISLSDISGVATWDMSSATNVKFFFGAQNSFINTSSTPKKGMSLTDLTPLTYWNLASANNFDQMFKGNVNLISLEGLEKWDTAQVIEFGYMFESCVSLTKEGTAHISNWTVPDTQVNAMFYGLPSSIIPTFTGANSGSGTSSGSSGSSTGGSSSGSSGSTGPSSSEPSYTEGGWTKSGNTWEKEILINSNYTYTIYEDNVPLYASNASSLNPIIITGDTVTITNVLETRDITVTKVWDDNSNSLSARPNNITVHLDSTSSVPSAYQAVEYIEANGTQYINTGLTSNSAYTYYTDGFVRRGGNGVLINSFSDNNNRMGSIVYNTSTARIACYWIINGNGKSYTDNCISGSSTIDLGARFQLTQSKNGITAVQDSNTLTSSYTANTVGTNSAPIYLLHSDQSNASAYNRGVLYGAKIYDENNNLLRDFHPVYRKADNTIGMYDTVTGTFFTNAGSGTFLKGDNITEGSTYSFVTDNSKWDKSGGNTWTYTFRVPDDGSNYVAYEDSIPSYTGDATSSNKKPVKNDAVTITNTVKTRTINLTKNWDDTGHASSRPNTINARLFTISFDTGQFKTIANVNQWTKSGNTWTASVTIPEISDLYLYEDTVPGYLSDATPSNPITIDNTNSATITNTIIESPKNITVIKKWLGDTDYTNLRTPPTVHLVPRDRTTPTGATLTSLTSSSTFRNKLLNLTPTSPTSISFHSNGNLPAGYTKATLQALPSIDLSAANDNSILAYHDASTSSIFIYSENQITAPADSTGLFLSQMDPPFGNLQTLDVAELDTSNVTNMSQMFMGLSQIRELNLTNFDTSNVTNMSQMFAIDSSLTTITVSDKFTTSAVTNSTNMFYNTVSIVGGNGSGYDSSCTDDICAAIDSSTTAGYFSAIPSNYDFVSDGNWSISSTGNNWTYTFVVPDDGVEYEAYEDPLEKYDSDATIDNKKVVTNDMVTISNTLKNQTVTVTKIWEDDSNAKGDRPNNIIVHLKKANALLTNPSSLSNPNNALNTLTPTDITSGTWIDNGDDTWTYTFTLSIGENLADYRVYEEPITGYTSDAPTNNPKPINTDGTVSITNTEAFFHYITILKKATGNLADLSQPFNFTVTIYDSNNNPVTGDFEIIYNGANQSVTLENGQFSETLQPNSTQQLMIPLPLGYKYRIIETNGDYTPTYEITEPTNTGTVNTVIPTTAGNDTGIQTPATDQTVTFDNNLEAAPPTGLFFKIPPLLWVALLLFIVAKIRTMIRRRIRYLNQFIPPEISLN